MVKTTGYSVKLYRFIHSTRLGGRPQETEAYSMRHNYHLFRYKDIKLAYVTPTQMYDVFAVLGVIYFLTQSGPVVNKQFWQAAKDET